MLSTATWSNEFFFVFCFQIATSHQTRRTGYVILGVSVTSHKYAKQPLCFQTNAGELAQSKYHVTSRWIQQPLIQAWIAMSPHVVLFGQTGAIVPILADHQQEVGMLHAQGIICVMTI